MLTSSRKENEHYLSVISLGIFVFIISFTTLLGISPILHSIFNATIYTTLLTGIFLVIQTINKIGVRNFVGKSMSYLGISLLVALLNIVLMSASNHMNINEHLIFNLNQYMWFVQAILMTSGIAVLLTMYKLNLPKLIHLEYGVFFLITLLTLSFFAGWPQILNTLLITAGFMSLRVSGKKIHSGIFYISLGLILLALSNIFFIYRYWNGISYFGDISDIILSVSWISVVLGIYFTKKYHA